jgi:hypothetical protein
MALVVAGCGAGEPRDRYRNGAQVCAALSPADMAAVLVNPEPGQPERVFGATEVGQCRWNSPSGDSLRITAEQDPLGSDHARRGLRSGQPAPMVAEYATIEITSSRTGWTVWIEAWLGGANTFQMRLLTDDRPDETAATALARIVADRLPTSGAYPPE